MKISISAYRSIYIDSEHTRVTKANDKQVQIMIENHTSYFVDTADLLAYLEWFTEEVRLINNDQNPREI